MYSQLLEVTVYFYKKGDRYRLNTLNNIVAAVQRHHVETLERPDLNFVHEDKDAFKGFWKKPWMGTIYKCAKRDKDKSKVLIQ